MLFRSRSVAAGLAASLRCRSQRAYSIHADASVGTSITDIDPSKLTITNHNGLTVSIDDHECFRTDKIALPAGLHLGIGAATSDNPDSFEAHSFIVKNLQPSSGSSANVGDTHQVVASSDHSAREANWQNSRNPHLGNEDPDADPHKIVDHQLQFDDLHIRLQHMAHTLNSMSDLQITEEERGHHRHNEVLSVAHNHAEFEKIHSKLETLERTLSQLQRDVANRPAGAPVGAPASSVTKQQIDEIAKGLFPLLFEIMKPY